MLPLHLPLPRVYVCLAFALLALAPDSRADAVLLRFAPPTGGVAGYKLYYAPLLQGPILSAPLDVGARAPDATGVASYTVSGLDPSQPYSFELTAYDARGVESARSNRLSLDARSEALGALLWSNDFSSYAPGVAVPGFVDETGDGQIAPASGLFDVAYFGDGNAALGTSTLPGAVESRFIGSASGAWGPYEISGRVFVSAASARAGIGVRSTVSGSSESSFELAQDSSGLWGLGSSGRPPLTCQNGSSSGVTQLGRWYGFRFRVTYRSGLTRLRASLWPWSAAAPSGWQADCWTTASSAPGLGVFALRRGGAGSAFFDDLAVHAVVGTLDPIPPTP